VRSFELVNAQGDLQRVTHESDPELFWALRGGGGEFGIIIAMDLELRLAPEIQGGRMMWPIEHARDVLRAFADVTETAPDELTLWAWLLNLPDVPFVPEPLRGKWVAAVDSTFLGSEEDNEKLLAPLRAVAEPIADTVARVPLSALGSIAQEPDEPVPGLIKTVLLSGFDSEAIDSLLEVAAPGTPSPLFAFEVRHFGGALARPEASQGVAGVIEEPYLLLFGGFVAGPGMAEAIEAAIDGVEAKMSPWITGHNIPNFSTTEPLTAVYSPESLDRLREIKHRVDPRATIRGNRPIA
jgi:FAD/FMN-containing dehydrogenase